MSGANAALGKAVVDGVLRTAKTDSSLKSLATTHQALKKCVDKAVPGRRLFAFGSIVVYGFMEAGSDVDFVVLDPKQIADGKGLDAATMQARQLQAHTLAQIARATRAQHRTLKIEEVKRTRVPVLRCNKAQPPAFPVPFDVTADRRNGVRNSWLLRSYFDQYPQARWLALAVKRWSKDTQMNGQAGFLTSYAFNILVVHYYRAALGKMQHVPLQTADVARSPELPSGCALKPPADMGAFGDEVAGFFDYYLKDFRYDDEVVSLSRAGATTAAELGWTREAEDALKMKASDDDGLGKVSYRLCIEDPFEINLNVGRNVSAFKLDVFKQNLAQGRLSGMGWLDKSL